MRAFVQCFICILCKYASAPFPLRVPHSPVYRHLPVDTLVTDAAATDAALDLAASSPPAAVASCTKTGLGGGEDINPSDQMRANSSSRGGERDGSADRRGGEEDGGWGRERADDLLIPPLNFGRVCRGVYRSGFPGKKNFTFLKVLCRALLFSHGARWAISVGAVVVVPPCVSVFMSVPLSVSVA